MGTDVHAGLGHTAAKGLVAGCVVRGAGGGEVGFKFIQLVLKSRSFLLGPSASIRDAGKMLCIYVNSSLPLSSKPSSQLCWDREE